VAFPIEFDVAVVAMVFFFPFHSQWSALLGTFYELLLFGNPTDVKPYLTWSSFPAVYFLIPCRDNLNKVGFVDRFSFRFCFDGSDLSSGQDFFEYS